MKKKYTLNYLIERDTDRLEAVREILDSLDTDPSNSDLEQMASYILYGKDENGQNAIQRKECTDADRRYGTFRRASERDLSLDAILESPIADQQDLRPYDTKNIYSKKVREIKHPKYDKQGNLVDPGDSDVPGMQELWERIAYIEKVVAANENKIPLDPDTMTLIENPYRLYQLKHQLIDMRRHQYYLRDSYKPHLYFLNVKPPHPQSINFDEDAFYWLSFAQWRRKVATEKILNPRLPTSLSAYETHFLNGKLRVKWIIRHQKFDWEDPKHVRSLLNNYSDIYMQNWDNLQSDGRALVFDFDYYVNNANFSPAREYMILRRVDKERNEVIAQEIQEKFGLAYNSDHLGAILSKEIVKQIVTGAKKHRMRVETPLSECKQCYACKQWFPRNALFFGVNRHHRDGWTSNCKECERKKRIRKGRQSAYDLRYKDTTLHQMQTREINS